MVLPACGRNRGCGSFGTLAIGRDAGSAVFGDGVGVAFRVLGTGGFMDIQYHLRTNAVHGRSGVPLRLGVQVF